MFDKTNLDTSNYLKMHVLQNVQNILSMDSTSNVVRIQSPTLKMNTVLLKKKIWCNEKGTLGYKVI